MDKENDKRRARKRPATEVSMTVPKTIKVDESVKFREGAIRKIVLHNFL